MSLSLSIQRRLPPLVFHLLLLSRAGRGTRHVTLPWLTLIRQLWVNPHIVMKNDGTRCRMIRGTICRISCCPSNSVEEEGNPCFGRQPLINYVTWGGEQTKQQRWLIPINIFEQPNQANTLTWHFSLRMYTQVIQICAVEICLLLSNLFYEIWC